MFVDIVGYTEYAESVSAEELVTTLEDFFYRLDVVCDRYRCLKVKTIGDAYMAAAGLLGHKDVRVHSLLKGIMFALDSFKVMEAINNSNSFNLELRAGLHIGEVTAGVLVFRFYPGFPRNPRC